MKKLLKFIKKPIVFSSIIGVILGLILGSVVFGGNGSEGDGKLVIKKGDFVQEVSVSGKVVAAESVDLVFSQSGRVSETYADVGDRVLAGTVIASLENRDAFAEILQKEAAYEAALAKLRSLEDGTRPEEIAVTESSVTNAEAALFDAVRNAFTQADNSIRSYIDKMFIEPHKSNPRLVFVIDDALLTVAMREGRINVEKILTSWKTNLSTISASEAESNIREVQDFLDTVALSVSILEPYGSLPQSTIDSYRADATAARSAVNSAASTLTSAINSLETAKRNLALDEAGTIAEEIAIQESQVKIAAADLTSANARYRKTLIIAPFSGIITKMDAKVGGSASTNSSDISIISSDTLQVESFIPEINIPFIDVGDPAIIALDAYGDTPFEATVISIDPAETVRDGVSTYKAKLRFNEKDERILPGMTANIVVTTEKKSDVIAVPQGIIIERGGKKFVKTLSGEDIVEKEVETGDISSLGTIEILSGLEEGETVLLEIAD